MRLCIPHSDTLFNLCMVNYRENSDVIQLRVCLAFIPYPVLLDHVIYVQFIKMSFVWWCSFPADVLSLQILANLCGMQIVYFVFTFTCLDHESLTLGSRSFNFKKLGIEKSWFRCILHLKFRARFEVCFDACYY